MFCKVSILKCEYSKYLLNFFRFKIILKDPSGLGLKKMLLRKSFFGLKEQGWIAHFFRSSCICVLAARVCTLFIFISCGNLFCLGMSLRSKDIPATIFNMTGSLVKFFQINKKCLR